MKTNIKTGRDIRRHIRMYNFARRYLSWFFSWKFNYKAEPIPEIDGNFIMLSNHTTVYDAIFVSMGIKPHLYYVASEHSYRGGFASKLLERYFLPIPRLKGTVGTSAVLNMKRELRAGRNIGLFPEGNHTFNGQTAYLPDVTAKFVKSCGASLVTYHLEGGYFTAPRWARTLRRGKMRGYTVNVYTPLQLAQMSVREVEEAIARDLWEDAYERQETEHVRFKWKRLAEGLESALYICPECGEIGKMSSRNDEIFCRCGMRAKYDEYGYLHGTKFSTVTEWDKWQTEAIREKFSRAEEREPLLTDNNIRLYRVIEAEGSELITEGTLKMSMSEISVGDIHFNMADFRGMAVYGRNTPIFTVNTEHYELKGAPSFNARKYLVLYDFTMSRVLIEQS